MAIIKSQQAERSGAQIVVLDLDRGQDQIDPRRQRADENARRIVDEAKAQAERIRREAREAGHSEGLAQGRAEGVRQGIEMMKDVQQAWIEAVRRWDGDRRQMQAEAERSLVSLAITIAEKIVRRVPRIDPGVVVEQVRAAIGHVMHATRIGIHVHPQDRPIIERAVPELMAAIAGIEDVDVVDDPSVTRGGCVVISGRGRIDATLEGQMQRIVEQVLPQSFDRNDAT